MVSRVDLINFDYPIHSHHNIACLRNCPEAIFMSQNGPKIKLFLIPHGGVRRSGPFLYIICTLLRPIYVQKIPLKALLLGELDWKK